MPHHLKKLTPNLVVADVDRSVAFYRDLLGFAVNSTVPEASPYVFAIVKSGGVEIYLNAPGPAHEEYPAFKGRPIGGTLTLFIDVDDIRGAYAELKGRVEVVMPLEKKWYGVTEFAFLDPDGYIITFAQVESGA
jgi:catechol 2,3-dioxygenase-like lactoylglutathione lyase family enzyme